MIKLKHLVANYYLLIFESGYIKHQFLLSCGDVLELKEAMNKGGF